LLGRLGGPRELLAAASSSVEVDDTVSTISPTAASNWSARRFISSLRRSAAWRSLLGLLLGFPAGFPFRLDPRRRN
jgi:hypothetical protein